MTNILVVDDSAVDRSIVGGLLKQRPDFHVLYAEDGTDALRSMENARPDIVVTDINMPQKNGLELVRAMRIHFGGVPVILITAQGSEELAVQALEHGAASYVPKVILRETLINTIDDVLAVVQAKRSYERLVGSIQRTEFDFTLENDPQLFDPFIELFQQIVHGMGLCDDTDRFRVGMALKEALSNALYRGNLEISFEQTRGNTEELIAGDEIGVVRERLALQKFADRRLHIHVRIDPDQAVFVIRDEGRGFDTSHLPTKGDLGTLDAEAGRGIVLMHAFMDEVTYNTVGNEVTLVKRRR
ncbi:MAG: response regulator [Pirellulaceae bacterium]